MLQKILEIRISELDMKFCCQELKSYKRCRSDDVQAGKGVQQGVKRINDLSEVSRVRATEY